MVHVLPFKEILFLHKNVEAILVYTMYKSTRVLDIYVLFLGI